MIKPSGSRLNHTAPEVTSTDKLSAPRRHPGMIALWLVLAIGYLVTSVAGMRVVAMAVVGLMVGALLAASGRLLAGAIASVVLAGLCLYFSASLAFVAYAPPLAAFAFMALFFYRTLRPGSVPLITRVARMEHPDLPLAMERYSRRLTWIWTFCFLLLFAAALGSTLILPLEVWSRWVQGLGYVLPGVLFLGEFAYRHHRFPDRRHGSLRELIPNIVSVSREIALSSGTRDAETRR